MARKLLVFAAATLLLTSAPVSAGSGTLRGSRASMERQNRIARENDLTFLRTPHQVWSFVAEGRLVPLEGNDDYTIDGASFAVARPVVRTFVERLAAQHHDACGSRLVVTSATRPESEQPRNASELSVHPAGMAVDLRFSWRRSCRIWLENTLLALENKGLLDVTRELHPPHYHVAIFPVVYQAYVDSLVADSTRAAIAQAKVDSTAAEARRVASARFAMTASIDPVQSSVVGTLSIVFGVIALLALALAKRKQID